MGSVAAIIVVLGTLLSLGWSVAKRLLPVWLLLWLLLPLPFRWDQRLVLVIHDWTSHGGSLLLDVWGCDHVLAGFVLEIPGRQFPIEGLCGGLASLFAAVSTAAVLAVWLRRGIMHGGLLVISGALWAIGINMIGVALTVVLLADGGVDVTSGWRYGLLGVGLFLTVLLMLLSTDRLLLFLFELPFIERVEDEEGELIGIPVHALDQQEANRRGTVSVPCSHGARVGLWLLTLGFLATGVWQVLAWRAYGQRVDARPGGTADRAEQIPWSGILTGGCLPPLPGGWQPVGFRTMVRALDSDLGRCSLVWHYSDARDEAVVALDFPFEGWHEPVRVYEVRGWEIESRRLLAEQEFSEPVVEVRMRDASGRRGYLLVRQFTESGVPVAPPADASWSLSEWYRRAGQRVRDRLGEANSTPSTVQVSLLITGDLPLDTTRQAQAQEAFRLAADRIAGILWDKEP